MQASKSETELVHTPAGEVPAFRSGVHIFAVRDGEGSKRQLTFGVSIPWSSEAYRFIAALFLSVMALIPSLLWAVRDRRVWPWDQAWYGEVSVDLWYVLTRAQSWWYRMMVEALGLKPPAVVWLGQFFVPFRHVFGSVEAALLFSILLTQLAVLILIYRICTELAPRSRGIGFLGIAAAAGAQHFVGLSHQMFAEPLQCLSVAWAVLIALRCGQWPRARILIHLASASLLGILAKASTPLYMLIPMAYIALSLFRSRRQPWDFRNEWQGSASSRALIYGFVVAGALGAVWYSKNYAAVLDHARISSFGEDALNYGTRAPLASKFFLWLGLLWQGFLDPYLGWILGLVILAAGIAVITRRPVSRRSPMLLAGILSVAQIAIVVLVSASTDTVETRYLYPLLPFVTIVIAALCATARYRIVQAVVALGCFAQWATVNLATFESKPVLASQSPWLLPIVSDPTAHNELSEVVDHTSNPQGYNIVAIEEPWLNENSAAFFAAKNRLSTGIKSQYTSVGYAQKDPAAAMKRIEDLSARFVITLDEPFQSSPNFLNLVSLPVLRELKANEDFTPVPFPSHTGILIFERQNRASASARR
jgi:hypothetical protein